MVAPVLLAAACGGGGNKKPVEPEPVVIEKPKPPPPPPPVCVQGGAETSLIGSVASDSESVQFCVLADNASNSCYSVDLGSQKYSKLDDAPKGQSAILDPDPARVETTNKEVKVCIGEDCRTVKPKVPKGNENPLEAVVNASGTHVAVLMGNAEKGKGSVQIFDVSKPKKPVATIKKYAKGEFKCGEVRFLGDTLYLSASECGGARARAYLYNLKGKKFADVGGKDFGTYAIVPLQLGDTRWAFLDENGATIAILDSTTGALEKTIDIGALWAGGEVRDGVMPADEEATAEDAPADVAPAPALGNPGESALVRGAEGKLVVVTGGPAAGSIGVVDIESGALESTITALACEVQAPPAEPEGEGGEEEPAAEDEAIE
jgi:hypothetical protein